MFTACTCIVDVSVSAADFGEYISRLKGNDLEEKGYMDQIDHYGASYCHERLRYDYKFESVIRALPRLPDC